MTLAYWGWAWLDPLYLLFVAPAMILAMIASARVRSAYARASEMPAASGITGAEAADMIMQAHGIRGVGIEEGHGGQLSDHYDPRQKVLRLSPEVYRGRSVASLGIAAHEAGHAVQDADHYAPLKFRNGIVPLAAVGQPLSWMLIVIGALMGGVGVVVGSWLIWGGIALFSVVVFFQLLTLPVEFDASRRAKALMQSSGLIAPGAEAAAMNRVLNAAAWTYIAAALSSIMVLLYYLVRFGGVARRE